jgi:hypothetical protein
VRFIFKIHNTSAFVKKKEAIVKYKPYLGLAEKEIELM